MSLFNDKYSVIGMCHLLPLPGDALYDADGGIEKIRSRALREIISLQKGGIDAIIFSNEFSTPYSDNVDKGSIATMSAIISSLTDYINVPFGIDCMYDVKASIAIATAVNANFVRGIFIGNYNTGVAQISIAASDVMTYYKQINNCKTELWCILPSEHIELMKNQFGIGITTLLDRITTEINPITICLHSNIIEKYKMDLERYKDHKNVKIYADGGCNRNNINMIKCYTNSLIIGTYLKLNHDFYNEIDENEVKQLISHLQNDN